MLGGGAPCPGATCQTFVCEGRCLKASVETVLLNYLGGEAVSVGDRVRRQGMYATVVFVSDGENEEAAPGYEDYRGSQRGVVLCDDDGNVDFIGEPDELLECLGRA